MSSCCANDYASISSNQNCHGKQKLKPACPRSLVRFDETTNRYYPNKHGFEDKEDCRYLWYTAADYRLFKTSIVQSISNLIRSTHAKASCQAIDEIFQQICLASCGNTEGTMGSFPTTAAEQQELAETDSLEEDQMTIDLRSLEQVYKNHLDVIGLESYIAKCVRRHKSNRRMEIVDAVLDAQDHLLLFSESRKNTMASTFRNSLIAKQGDRIKEAILRGLCERLSEPSRCFAQQIAAAQQEATAFDDETFCFENISNSNSNNNNMKSK
ncbi:hypothetical protein ACA910_021974 [Epithemia clementina (nom. ined.)]